MRNVTKMLEIFQQNLPIELFLAADVGRRGCIGEGLLTEDITRSRIRGTPDCAIVFNYLLAKVCCNIF